MFTSSRHSFAALCTTAPTYDPVRSRERGFDVAQPAQLHPDLVAGGEPHGLDQAAGQHDLAGAEVLAAGGEMVGEPGECVVGMAEHVRAAALPGFNAVDERAADDAEHVWRGGPRHRLAERAARGEKVVRYQRRSSQRLPILIAVIDDLDCRKIFLHGSRGGLSRKWCRGSD